MSWPHHDTAGGAARAAIAEPVVVIERPARSRPAAALALGASGLFVLLLAILHLLRPDLDPGWRVISEYAIGRYGMLMSLAFAVLALAYIALIVTLWRELKTVPAWIGALLLLVSAAGVLIAALFTSDPLTAGAAERTLSGKLHEFGAMLDFLPLAALLLSLSLSRPGRIWQQSRRAVMFAALLTLAGALYFMYSLLTEIPVDGSFGPDVRIGWPGRVMILMHCVWLAVAAWATLPHRAVTQTHTNSGDSN